ncbi:ABC-three component system middle component 6 [Clostridium sp.]|uniref:ABC-three component system middle component 6 n=1 Tax=Clostridium sp. TaxID=1506 RepID=UPI003216905A
MILPKKHIKLSESLFALGAIILSELKKQGSVDSIWESVSSKSDFNIRITFDNFILTLDYLYSIGAIDINEDGGVFKCT